MGKKKMQLAFISLSGFLLILLSGYLSHIFTVNYYEDIKNKQLELYSLEISDKVVELDTLANKIYEIEVMFGIEYEHEDIPLEERMNTIKTKTAIKLTKDNIKDSIPRGKPLKKIYVTGGYGFRTHPITKRRTFHRGLDLRARIGEKVYATAPGVVRLIEKKNNSNMGRYIVIQHNMGFESYYGHLNRINVKNGDIIKKGDIIGKSGNSGKGTGPHLHYEVRFGGQSIAPII